MCRGLAGLKTDGLAWEHNIAPASRDERADIGNGGGPLPRVLIGHVARHPLGIELLLVEPQPLKVVPVLAVLEEQVRQALARVRAVKLAHARQRRHAKVEARVALFLSVKK